MADDTVTPTAMPPAPTGVTYACTKCPVTKVVPTKRLPRGWKDIGGVPVCDACLEANWSVRAITLPVARIVGRVDSPNQLEDEGAEPVEGFLRHFHDAWRQATDLANWAMRELVRRDVRRAPGMVTLPKYDPKAMFGENPRRLARKGAGATQVETIYSTWNALMPVAWRQLWDGCATTAGAILKQVEDTWKGHESFGRFAVLWLGRARPMVAAYPAPWPVPKQNWRGQWSVIDGQRRPILSVVMPGGRLVLELDRTPELRRQLADFDALVSGAAQPGDVKLCPVSRGGRVVGVKAVIAGRFPRSTNQTADESVAIVRTSPGPDTFMTVEIEGRDPFHLNAAHLRGVVNGYVAWLKRYREDLKHEKRWPAAKRRAWVERAQAHQDRHKGRIDSEMKQLCAAVVGYVARQRCAGLVYHDADRSFLEMWPWAATRERLRCLCGEGAIRFQHVAQTVDSTI